MLQQQRGLCAVCQRPSRDGRSLCVDHDHKTGRVRGLLCSSCNKALGFVDDEVGILLGLALYLQQHKE